MSFTFFLPLLSYPDATPRAGLLRAFDMAASMGGEVTAVVHEVDIPDHNAFADTLIDVRGMIAAAEGIASEATMHIPDAVRNVLGWYDGERPGVKANLARLLMHGRTGGTGKLVILPVVKISNTGRDRASGPTPLPTIRSITSSSRSMRASAPWPRRLACYRLVPTAMQAPCR